MAFKCPRCREQTLLIAESAELGPDDVSDERSLQLITCPCGFVGTALYEESRRGAGESFRHRGYELGPAEVEVVRQHMARKKMPTPILENRDGFWME